MLSLGKIAAGPAAARYYTDRIARGQDDYYAGKREEPGVWMGAGAGRLGWQGVADPDRFAELLDGAGLRRPPAGGAVAGIDLTFRAPKSVSVLWAIAPDDIAAEMRAAHDAAVVEAFGYVERHACVARRGAGGAVQVPGGGFVAAAFMHRASRAGDPLLHTHVVVGNLTQGPDGRWTALDARHLYRHAKTAGYLYQAVLRREVTERLGLQWHAVERGVADIRGVDREVIEHFSRRRAEIVEHLAEHGGRSARAAQIAALETRRAKNEPPLARQRAEWRARAAEHGLTPDRVLDLFGRLPLSDRELRDIDIAELTEQASTFGRPEVLQALAEQQGAGARVRELERLADDVLCRDDVVRVDDRAASAGVIEARFSTRELLATEARLLHSAEERRQTRTAVVSPVTTRDVLDAHHTLNDEQRQVVRRLCEDGDGIAVVRAAAGTGKTFALDAAREAWQREGIDVRGCALSARAARELQDQSAIASHTIAAIRRDLERGREIPRGGVLIVDEAGMVGTRALAELADAAARADAKLVLVGDDRQLPEIEAGGAFHALAERLDALELREVQRQREAWDRQALEQLRSGKVEEWARAYRDAGRITVARRADEARIALVNDWSRADGDALMIAARRSDVRDLNHRARALLRDQGRLGRDELTTDLRGFATGDRVITTRNDHRLGVLNGQRGTIRSVDPDRRTVTVTLGDRDVELPGGYLDDGHLDHGYAITAHRAQGATVDRTFVLGSDELYREWGYTALSRHRDQARFYVSRGDLDLDRDQPPSPDAVAYAIQRLLGRSHAKDLATPDRDRDSDAIRHEHDQLRERLAVDPPPLTPFDTLRESAEQAGEHLRQTRERIDRLHHEREHTPLWRRADRARLSESIDANAQCLPDLEERHQQADAAYELARDHRESWLAEHGPDAERYLDLAAERADRDRLEELARRRLERLRHRDPALPDPHDLKLPHHERGMDLGW